MDLNLQLRYGTEWDPTNAISLLGHINAMGYKEVFNFELGNGKSFSIFYSEKLIFFPRFLFPPKKNSLYFFEDNIS